MTTVTLQPVCVFARYSPCAGSAALNRHADGNLYGLCEGHHQDG